MGMGRAGGAFQNATNNVQNGMGGKGGQQPQGGFRGKGGAQQTQGGFGGKGAGRFQPQQPPQGGFSGKGGQQQNPYAQQYYQPQFQPEYFNNPYSQGGFGQQPQMGGFGGKGGQSGIGDFERRQLQQGGMGGKGGQMRGMSDLQRLAPNMQGDGASYQDYVNRPTQEMKMSEEQFNAQRNGMPQYGIPEQQGGSYNRGNVPDYARPYIQQLMQNQQGGMGGKGGQRDTSQQAYNNFMAQASFAPGGAPTYEQWAAQRQSADTMGPILQKPGVPQRDMGYGNGPGNIPKAQYAGGMGGKGGPMSGYRQQLQQRRMADMLRGVPQQSGLAALAQPTATTQAASPAPEQPYMGNYLQ
jgi:hypothetical protein